MAQCLSYVLILVTRRWLINLKLINLALFAGERWASKLNLETPKTFNRVENNLTYDTYLYAPVWAPTRKKILFLIKRFVQYFGHIKKICIGRQGKKYIVPVLDNPVWSFTKQTFFYKKWYDGSIGTVYFTSYFCKPNFLVVHRNFKNIALTDSVANNQYSMVKFFGITKDFPWMGHSAKVKLQKKKSILLHYIS